MRIAWEEPFGPVVPIMRVDSVERAVEHCNANNLALQVRTWGGCRCLQPAIAVQVGVACLVWTADSWPLLAPGC